MKHSYIWEKAQKLYMNIYTIVCTLATIALEDEHKVSFMFFWILILLIFAYSDGE